MWLLFFAFHRLWYVYALPIARNLPLTYSQDPVWTFISINYNYNGLVCTQAVKRICCRCYCSLRSLKKQLILISCALENTPQIKSNFVKSARKDNTKITFRKQYTPDLFPDAFPEWPVSVSKIAPDCRQQKRVPLVQLKINFK